MMKNTNSLLIVFGIFSLLISASTWIMDLTHLVEACMYCRNERTVIGLLGIIMILPKRKYLTSYSTLLFGFFGAYVAADQIFSHMFDGKINLMMILAAGALVYIVGQVFTILCIMFQPSSAHTK